MRRRNFLAGLGVVAAYPLASKAQRSAMPTVGVLMAGTENSPENRPRIAAFRQAFAELGWTDGDNVHVIYRWSVAVVLDSAQRSTDVTASGLIRHVRSAPGPASADPESIARILAEKGYWYDALTALSLDIDRQPARRKQRADLLEQVGLTAPAAYDRAALGKTPSH